MLHSGWGRPVTSVLKHKYSYLDSCRSGCKDVGLHGDFGEAAEHHASLIKFSIDHLPDNIDERHFIDLIFT